MTQLTDDQVREKIIAILRDKDNYEVIRNSYGDITKDEFFLLEHQATNKILAILKQASQLPTRIT